MSMTAAEHHFVFEDIRTAPTGLGALRSSGIYRIHLFGKQLVDAQDRAIAHYKAAADAGKSGFLWISPGALCATIFCTKQPDHTLVKPLINNRWIERTKIKTPGYPRPITMLVDEEGLLTDGGLNTVAHLLYGGPIKGEVLLCFGRTGWSH